MEPEDSLPRLQLPATCPYPKPDQPTPHRSSQLLKIHFNSTLPFKRSFPSGVFPSSLPTKTLYAHLLSPLPATCPAHLILLDLIARIIFGEQYSS